MLLERGVLDQDLSEIFNGGFLNDTNDLSCLSLAKNLLEIGKSLQACGIVWGDVKPGNFVQFKKPGFGYVFKAIDFSGRTSLGA